MNYAGNTYRVNIEYLDPSSPNPNSFIRVTALVASGQPQEAEEMTYLDICGAASPHPGTTSASGTPAKYRKCISSPIPAGATSITVYAVTRIESLEDAIAILDQPDPPPPVVTGVQIDPSDLLWTVSPGGTQQFTAVVLGQNLAAGVAWVIDSPTQDANTQIDANGLLTVGMNEPVGNTLSIKAVSLDDNRFEAISHGNIVGIPVDAVVISPNHVSVGVGSSYGFSAQVLGPTGTSQTVLWSVIDNTSSSTVISSAGTLTIGANEQSSTVGVMATSVQDASKTAQAIVTVTGTVAPGATPSITINSDLYTRVDMDLGNPPASGFYDFPINVTGVALTDPITVSIINDGATVASTYTEDVAGGGTGTLSLSVPQPNHNVVGVKFESVADGVSAECFFELVEVLPTAINWNAASDDLPLAGGGAVQCLSTYDAYYSGRNAVLQVLSPHTGMADNWAVKITTGPNESITIGRGSGQALLSTYAGSFTNFQFNIEFVPGTGTPSGNQLQLRLYCPSDPGIREDHTFNLV